MLNNLFLNAAIYRVDPWPRPEKHCAHFKIWVLKYCRVLKKLTIKSRQGGPVNLRPKALPFSCFRNFACPAIAARRHKASDGGWFRDYLFWVFAFVI